MPRLALGRSQFAVLLAGIVAVLAVCGVLLTADLRYWYLREISIPQLEQDYGFLTGTVSFRRVDRAFDEWGIVRLVPGSPLAALGVRPRDVPTADRGGMSAMYEALRAAERREFAAFDVINADDWNARNETSRRIVAYPRGADTPVDFRWADGELASPSGRFVLLGGGSPGAYELWLLDKAREAGLKLYTYQLHVSAVWSPDEKWIAVTDLDDSRYPRCLLADASGGAAVNISDLLANLPAVAGEGDTKQRVACEVFGWIRGTSRLALNVRVANDEASTRDFRGYFLDLSTWTFTDARSAAEE